MNGNKNWLSWLGLGLGALALVIVLFGGSFGSFFPSSPSTPGMPAMSTQQSGQSQNMPQGGQFTPNTNDQRGGGMQHGTMQRSGDPGRNGGSNVGRWFGLPFKLLGWLRDAAIAIVLVALGVALLRNRGASHAASTAQAPSSQPQQSPTGETYTEDEQ